ncbi:diacylglycerol kinase [Clostridium pasteurianum]|uniref:diacylglycerol kinase n=1 Tax=Clostridium pasteurianum TaxID=1501 RepID=UPI002260B3B7|nr:diacylglycerol kinase [Clostridium pasteurianum]UZW12636.1 diacylglycerol kinase [Clostridium pasteurianum]
MKVRKVVDSFNYAIDGILYAVRTQRNMRIEMIGALLVLTACFFTDLSKIELLIITITITMVISSEMVNTAVECTVDMSANYYHPLAKIAKNVAAGAVLVTAINSVLVGYIIFGEKLKPISFNLIAKIKNSNPYMIFFILVIVSISTLIIKAIFGEGTPLRGGMPSGHSAIAFAIATSITLMSQQPTVIILSYFLAFIVAQSRVDSEVHSILEVLVGGIFGTLLTILLFRLFE